MSTAQTEPHHVENTVDQKENAHTLGKIETNSLPQEQHDDISLLKVTRMYLRQNGVRKSPAAIRDAVSVSHNNFDAAASISALLNYGFKANLGQLDVREIKEDHLPCIAFKHDGSAILLQSFRSANEINVFDPGKSSNISFTKVDDLSNTLNGYVILGRKLTNTEKDRLNGHWFFSAFRKSRWTYVQVGIAAMLSNFLGLSSALFMMTVYDRIIPTGAIDSLMAISIGVVIALGFDFLIKNLKTRFIDAASKKADLEVSRRLFDRILRLTPEEQKRKTGAMANVIQSFEQLREFFNSSTLSIFIDLPFVLFFIFVIWIISGPLAYVPMAVVPIVIIVGLGIQPFLAKITKGLMDSGMNKQAVLVETLNGIETITATGSGNLMLQRYEEALLNQNLNGSKRRALSELVVNFAASLAQYAQVATIFVGVFLITNGTITMGGLLAAVILGGRIMGPLSQLATSLSRANDALNSYRALDQLIGGSVSALDRGSVSRPKLDGEIEFKNVTFAFDESTQPLIKDLTLKIPKGQKVALVGKMGSGKSTISKLVAGLLAPTSGSVLIDGIDVRQIEPSDLRRNVGIMLQNHWLFSGTIRENILMGHNEYDDEHLIEICQTACVDDFVKNHPKGYEMEIRERGIGLSGGQQQTINLARSLINDPAIILLDEPTSAMDQGTEASVINNLGEKYADRTMLIITHRNSILQIVDRVLVMDNGKIIADQTPEQLGVKRNK